MLCTKPLGRKQQEALEELKEALENRRRETGGDGATLKSREVGMVRKTWTPSWRP